MTYSFLPSIFIFVWLSISLHHNIVVNGQGCTLSAGCYPPIFNILEDIANFPKRTLQVSSTCGDSSPDGNTYENLKGLTQHTCLPSQFNASNMVDMVTQGSNPTFWMSEMMIATDGATPVEQFIVFNFTDEFLLYEVRTM